MDMSEALLFQHISIMIKLLNSFINKNNVTSPHILRRLDYLQERLADFLGRDLDNEWWSDNKVESQLTYVKSPQHLTARTETSSSRAESIDSQPQCPDTAESELKPLNLDSAQNVGTLNSSSVSVVNFDMLQNNITEIRSYASNVEIDVAQIEVQKNDTISSESAQSSSIEANNCGVTQDVRITETDTYAESINFEPLGNTGVIENRASVSPTEYTACSVDKSTDTRYKCRECNEEIILFNSNEALSLSLHVQSSVHQQAVKQKTEKSAVNITAERHITENVRTDLGKYITERITKTYSCRVCNVNSFDSVRSHVLESNHQENMREKYGVEYVGTEAICEKIITTYHCGLCSRDTSGIKNLQGHITGQLHVKNMLEGISDANISTTVKGYFYCKLCFVTLGSQHNVAEHLQGKLHKKKLKAKEEEVSLQSVCERQKNVHLEAQFSTFSNIAMVCKVCNVYVLKVHLKDHISSEQHLKAMGTSQ